jgi:hypothetical protein
MSDHLSAHQPLNGAATGRQYGSYENGNAPVDLSHLAFQQLSPPAAQQHEPNEHVQQQQWQQQQWHAQQQQQLQQQQQQHYQQQHYHTPAPHQFYADGGYASGYAPMPSNNECPPHPPSPAPSHQSGRSFGSFQQVAPPPLPTPLPTQMPRPPMQPVPPPFDPAAALAIANAENARLRLENENLVLAARIATLEASATTATRRTRTSFGATTTGDAEQLSTEPHLSHIAPLPTATITTLKTLGGTLEHSKIEYFVKIVKQRVGSHDTRVRAMLNLSDAALAAIAGGTPGDDRVSDDHRNADAWLAHTIVDCLDHAATRPQNLIKRISASQLASGRALLRAILDTTVFTLGVQRLDADAEFLKLAPFTQGMKAEEVERAATDTVSAYKRLQRYNAASPLDVRMMLINKLPDTMAKKRSEYEEALLQADIVATDDDERACKPWTESQLITLIALALKSTSSPVIAHAAEHQHKPPRAFDNCLACGEGGHRSKDCKKRCKNPAVVAKQLSIANCPCIHGDPCPFAKAEKPIASEICNASKTSDGKKKRTSPNVFKYLLSKHKEIYPTTYQAAAADTTADATPPTAQTNFAGACCGNWPRLESYCCDAGENALLCNFIEEPYASAAFGENPEPSEPPPPPPPPAPPPPRRNDEWYNDHVQYAWALATATVLPGQASPTSASPLTIPSTRHGSTSTRTSTAPAPALARAPNLTPSSPPPHRLSLHRRRPAANIQWQLNSRRHRREFVTLVLTHRGTLPRPSPLALRAILTAHRCMMLTRHLCRCHPRGAKIPSSAARQRQLNPRRHRSKFVTPVLMHRRTPTGPEPFASNSNATAARGSPVTRTNLCATSSAALRATTRASATAWPPSMHGPTSPTLRRRYRCGASSNVTHPRRISRGCHRRKADGVSSRWQRYHLHPAHARRWRLQRQPSRRLNRSLAQPHHAIARRDWWHRGRAHLHRRRHDAQHLRPVQRAPFHSAVPAHAARHAQHPLRVTAAQAVRHRGT